jgi:hypothetical protein
MNSTQMGAYLNGLRSMRAITFTGHEPPDPKPLVNTLKTVYALRIICSFHRSIGVKGKPVSCAFVSLTSL